MDQILGLMGEKTLAKRLTIKLADEPTNALFRAKPDVFYSQSVNIDNAWQKKQDAQAEFCAYLHLVDFDYLRDPTRDPHKRPTQEQIDTAEQIFRNSLNVEELR